MRLKIQFVRYLSAVMAFLLMITNLSSMAVYADDTVNIAKTSAASSSSRTVTLVRSGSEVLGPTFTGDEAGATQHRFTYPVAKVKDTSNAAGYCITPFSRGVSPSGQEQTFTTVPDDQLDELDKKLLGIMLAGYPNTKHGKSEADEYMATQIAIQHFVFQHPEKYPNSKKVKFNDDSWSHWGSHANLELAKTIYEQGINKPYEPGNTAGASEIKAVADNNGEFSEVENENKLKMTISIETDVSFSVGKLTLPDEIKNIVKSGKGTVTIDGKNADFKAYILGGDDSYEGIPIPNGAKSVEIVLDKLSAEAYVPVPGQVKSVPYQFQVMGGDTMQAYKGNNLNSNNQDYIFMAPADVQSVAATLSWTRADEIITVSDPGTGGLKVLKYNKKTNTLVAGAIFEIRGVSETNWDFLVQIQASPGAAIPLPDGGKAVTGVGFIELIDIRPGQYQVTEITPPPNFDYCALGTNSKVVTVVDSGVSGLFPQVEFENNPFASLKIKKIDAVTGNPVNNVILRIRNPLADFDVEKITMNGGVIELNNLPQGNYEITEVFAPNKYVKSNEVKVATLRWGETTEITFENQPKTELQIKKVDAETGKALEGAIFRLTKPDSGSTWEDVTYYDGYIYFSDIPPGTYVLEELSAPTGYILDSTKRTIVVENNKLNEVYIENHKKPGLIIKKYDEKTGLPLGGAEFSIAKKGGPIVHEGIMGSNGTMTLENLASDWYTITEIAAPQGYLIATKSRDVFLEPDTVLEVKVDNRPRPELLIVKTDDKGKPVANALFEIKKTDGETIFERWTDTNGQILISFDDDEIALEEGIYSVKELKAPDGYVMGQDCHKDITLVWGQRKTLTFINTKQPTLTILKIDEETKEPLPGAKFKIVRTEDETIMEGLTDNDGKILLIGLEPGIYSVEELIAPSGYLLETQHKDIELNPGDEKELIWTNKAKPRLRIQKVDANTGELLKNSEFRVTKVEDKTVSEYILENGEIILNNLDEAVYRAEEFQAPEGYVMVQSSKEIMTQWGKAVTLKFDNVRKPVVMFQKTNALTGKGIPGAKFKVEFEMTGGGVKTIGSFTTDANGRITIPKAEPGWYIFTETFPAPGYSLPKNPVTRQYFAPGDNAYLLSTESYYANSRTGVYASGYAPNDGTTQGSGTPTGLNEDTDNIASGEAGDQIVSFANLEVHYGSEYYVEGEGFNWPLNSIVLKKADANTGELLAGATIELYRADEQVSGQPGTQIGRYVTDASGVVVVVGLEPGYYVAKEVQAPANYVLAETSLQNGFLKPDGTSIVEFTFRNYPFGSILVTKVDGVTGEPLANARFKVTDNAGAAVGNSAGEFTTDSRGEALVENIPPGSYVVTEIQAPDNYVINTTPKTVQVGTDGKTYKVSFDNYPYGAIMISKIDGVTKEPLAGARFKVTDNSGAAVGNTTGEFTTDSSGEILVEDVAPGSYIVTEIQAPDNYAINTTPKTLVVGTDGKTYKVSFDNYPYGAILISKVDGLTGEPLANARFKVTDNSGKVVGNTNGEYTTDSSGEILIQNIAPGSYIVTEIQAPANYAINTTPKPVEVGTDGKTYKVSFDNYPYATLVIKKLDTDTREPLSGAEFLVTTSKGDIVGTGNGYYTTDATGTITIPNLPKDSYIIKETKAPAGYVLENQTKTISVDYGNTYTQEFFNTKKSSLQIVKLDGQTKQPLKDAIFNIYKMNGELLGQYTTNSEGLIILDELANGWYKVSEYQAPDGYLLDNTPQDVEIVGNQFVKLIFENQPKASLIIKKFDATTKEPLMGAKFKITKKSGEIIGEYTTNANGMIQIDRLDPGWYSATEVTAPDGYKIYDMAQDFEIIHTKTVTLEFPNQKLTSLIIKKIDDKTGAPLAGAEFYIERQNGLHVGEYTTDSDGLINLPTLTPDWYVVREIKAPDGYYLDETPKTVEVKTDTPTVITFTNKKLTALEIKKTDELSGEPLAGAKFAVEKQNGERVGEYTTDNTGLISIPTLSPDWYIVRETKAPSGYLLDETPKVVEVKTTAPTVVTFTNKKLTALQIKKVDEKSGKPLGGAKFAVEKQNGERVGEYTTDNTGFINIPTLAPGWYIIRETKAPDGYTLDETPKTVEVKTDVPTVVTFTNKLKSGFQIVKIDAKSGTPLPGAKFTVYKKTGEVIGEYTTDNNGVIIVDSLDNGWYKIAETKAPDGYIISESPKDVELTGNQFLRIVFENKKMTSLEIKKVDAVSGAPLPGAQFTVEKQNGEKVFTNENGTIFTTDGQGIINIPTLEPDYYIVREVKAPVGYVMDESPKTVQVKTDSPTVVTFENKKMTALQIKKIDGVTGNALPGAKFTIEKQNGEKIQTNENGTEFTTDEQGLINIPNLPPDYYIVREIKAPDGYVIDETPKTVQVKTDSPTIVTVENKPLSGLKIVKINSVTKAPIAGVEFEIAQMNGEKVPNGSNTYRFITDKTGQIYVPSLTDGYYVVTETKAADGYFLDGQPRTVEVKSGKPTVLEIENSPASGLLIVKTDAKTGQPLQGVVFDVRKADGQRVMSSILEQNQPNTPNNSPNKNTMPNGDISGSYVTDANGRILINTLEPGEYHVIETKALDGYILDKDVHAVTVVPGKQASLQLTNTPMSGLRILKIDSVTKKGIYDVEFRVYDFETNKEVGGPYRTDNNGVIDFSGILPEGRYTLVETREAPGYLRDTLPRTVEFKAGKILDIIWENTPQMGQVQVTKKSASDNEVNGLPAGTPLAGATFEIYQYKTGNLMDQFTTGNNGVGVSKPLPTGRYILKEVVSPKYYKLNDKEIDFEIEFSSQIVKFEFTNEPANTGVSIKKVGPAETMSGQQIRYDFKVIQNTSTVPLTDFYWRDIVPGNMIRVDKLITGTYNQALKYKIMFKTNKNDYRVMADNLSTTHNNVVEASPAALGLFSDEYVTEIMFVFGNVKAGFSIVESPSIYATVKSGIPKGTQFANKADVGGKYGNEWIVGNTVWVTTVYSSQPDKLPRTGW